jgi:hypothetical protein
MADDNYLSRPKKVFEDLLGLGSDKAVARVLQTVIFTDITGDTKLDIQIPDGQKIKDNFAFSTLATQVNNPMTLRGKFDYKDPQRGPHTFVNSIPTSCIYVPKRSIRVPDDSNLDGWGCLLPDPGSGLWSGPSGAGCIMITPILTGGTFCWQGKPESLPVEVQQGEIDSC